MTQPLLRLAGLIAVLCAAPSVAAAQRTNAKPLDRANLDTTCAPCSDFYQFANGTWLKKHAIPPDKTGLGSFGMLSDRNQEVVQKIVVDDASLARSGETKPGTNEWKIGTFYMACMDTASMDAAGLKPIKPLLDAVAAIRTTDDVVKVFGNRRGGGGGGGRGGGGGLAPFNLGPQTDARNSTMVILSANQGGLILNREDYLDSNERATRRRVQYAAHIARSLQLLGETEAETHADADSIIALETRIAKITIPQADLRDPNATYHKMTLGELGAMTPHINWARYLEQQGAKSTADVNVRTPTFFTALDSLIASVPVDNWKAYLKWHATSGAMASLSTPFRREAFHWQQVTSGVQQPEPRLKQCASATNAALGEAVGEEWVKRNFTPAAKARAARMVDNLVSALRDRIKQLDW